MDVDVEAFIEQLDGREQLTEAEVKLLLQQWSIPVPDFCVLSSPDTLDDLDLDLDLDLERDLPAVAKVCSPSILHKTDVDGVKLGLSTPEAVRDAVGALFHHFPDAAVLIEPMEAEGLEIIMGLLYDQTFGPSIMVGLGGIYTEVYQDVSFRVVPISRHDAEQMLEELRGSAILDGYRGQRYHRESVIEILLTLSQLSEAFGERIAQMDLNPVFVRENDAVVVDAKMILRDEASEG